jgi:hypothetical protein
MVGELILFWEYVDRVFDLPNARPIVEWLKTAGLVARLEAELSDPENYGMAKSIFMAGERAGYDMTSPGGISQFMAAYNQLLQPEDPAPARSTIVTEHPKIGRNDPCPCGSGKKYKKCCRNR